MPFKNWSPKLLAINALYGVGGPINCWWAGVWRAVFEKWGRRSIWWLILDFWFWISGSSWALYASIWLSMESWLVGIKDGVRGRFWGWFWRLDVWFWIFYGWLIIVDEYFVLTFGYPWKVGWWGKRLERGWVWGVNLDGGSLILDKWCVG